MNNPHWQSNGITIFLCKYIVISDTLGGSFFDVFFLLLAVILSVLHEKPSSNKDSVTKKSTEKNLCEGRAFFDHTPSFLLCHLLSSFTPSLSKGHTCWMTPIKIHNIPTGGILCDDIMSERSKIWKSLAIYN